MKDERNKYVAFADESIKEAFDMLGEGKFEDKEMHGFISRAMDDLKQNSFIGIHIPSRLWPKIYVRKYGINNLWKYDLPNGWRLVYTIRGSEIDIVSIILEWMGHTEYNRRFKY